jgi:tRNA(Ile)-lysidine synthase
MAGDIERSVAGFIRGNGLNGATLIVAVSGGPDSVCLLHLLTCLRDTLEICPVAAHIDHGLRQASAQDAAYVSRLCAALGIPLTMTRADVNGYRKAAGMSTEEAAREVRYSFLAGVASGEGTKYVVTGHTRNDQVETILMHIIRGSGISGLIGLKPLTTRTIEGHEMVILRPLLDISRSETEAYCMDHGLEPVLDESNLSLSLLRNRIRMQALPLFRSYNRGVEDALVRLSRAATTEKAFIDGEVARAWPEVVQDEGDVITIDKIALLSRHTAMQGHILRRVIERLLGEIRDIEMRHIDDIISILSRPAGSRLDLPYGLSFTVGYDRCWLGPLEKIPSPYPRLDGEWPLKVPGLTPLPGWEVNIFEDETCQFDQRNSLAACLDFDSTGTELAVRGRRVADRFRPLGINADKKLGEFMIDEKIPRHWRRNVPVVVSPVGLVWVVGYRIDARFMVKPGTRRVLKVEFHQRRK